MFNIENTIVGKFNTDNLFVSTVLAFDSDVYETAIGSPYYNNGQLIIVETYESYSQAFKGHESWVKVMNREWEELPEILKTSHSTFLSVFFELVGGQQTFEKMPKDILGEN